MPSQGADGLVRKREGEGDILLISRSGSSRDLSSETLIPSDVSRWECPPEHIRIAYDEVHAWLASLELTATRIESLWQTLSDDERARAGRLRSQTTRRDYIAARGILRAILGRYLREEPRELRFGYTVYGKPFLLGEFSNALSFNLSHSHGMALYAVTRGREIGVDLEQIHDNVEHARIADRFFSPREIAWFRSVPPPIQKKAFFTCWTRKEAYLKARGDGLSRPLNSFDVVQRDTQWPFRWSIQDLAPLSGYVAALAVKGSDWTLHCWRWPE